MTIIKVEYKPTLEQYKTACKYLTDRIARPAGVAGRMIKLIAFVAFVFGLIVLLRTLTDYQVPVRSHVQPGLILITVGVFVFLAMIGFEARHSMNITAKASESFFLESIKVEILPEGLKLSSASEQTVVNWLSVTEVMDDSGVVYVHRGPAVARYIPATAFPSYQDYKSFVAGLRQYVVNARCAANIK
jgi:hypothetical protein